jgi:predicted AAA+ superfamily ATPase
MLIQRDMIGRIKPFLKRREFLAVIGPRQAGKTTFLEIIKKYLIADLKVKPDSVEIVTFEDRRKLQQFEADPVAFVNSYKSSPEPKTLYLMIDEFQYAQNGGQKLKLVYDTVRNVKIIITGSSSLDIRAQVGKYLVGRVLTFHLFPFSFGERLKANNNRLSRIYQEKQKGISDWLFSRKKMILKNGKDAFAGEMLSEYEDYCLWGGYPAVVLSKTKQERRKVINDIYNNYLLKDVKGLLELAADKNLLQLSQYLAAQIGNIAVYNNLCQASGLNYRQLIRHLNILQETFVCEEVRPFFKNRQKELSKNPKIFFNDLGFRNDLMDNMNALDKRPDAGSVIENAVFIRLKELVDESVRINFWRTKAGAEVDFVLQHAGKIVPVEVKFSGFDKEKITRSFASFIDSFKPDKGLILTKDYWGRIRRGKTEIIFAPVYCL